MMANIRGKNTKPELVVRRVIHALGFRFRLHRRDLPGSPDLVFPRLRKAVLVHGCFWHRHPGCKYATTPRSNVEFWNRKFEQNQERDNRTFLKLVELGWTPLIIWECETRNVETLRERVALFLGGREE